MAKAGCQAKIVGKSLILFKNPFMIHFVHFENFQFETVKFMNFIIVLSIWKIPEYQKMCNTLKNEGNGAVFFCTFWQAAGYLFD